MLLLSSIMIFNDLINLPSSNILITQHNYTSVALTVGILFSSLVSGHCGLV